jgi:sugar phosphate isomerase/epimerase
MFTLNIDTGNAAFDEDEPNIELTRILREVIGHLNAWDTEGKIRDLNGNTVGSWKLV